MTQLLITLLLAALLSIPAIAQAAAARSCHFVLGFAALYQRIPNVVGQCVQNQYGTANGNAYQHTTNGLLVWKRDTNWTGFTNGYHT